MGARALRKYRIMNLNDATIEVYREPNFTGYGSKTVLHAQGPPGQTACVDAAVDVAELLKRDPAAGSVLICCSVEPAAQNGARRKSN